MFFSVKDVRINTNTFQNGPLEIHLLMKDLFQQIICILVVMYGTRNDYGYSTARIARVTSIYR